VNERIAIDPNVCGCQPCIKGTRIPVYIILDLLEAGYTFERIVKECYPQITPEDIKACISYAKELGKGESNVKRNKPIKP